MEHVRAAKSHDEERATTEARDRIAVITQGSTPEMIEHLVDEAMANVLWRGPRSMSTADLRCARLSRRRVGGSRWGTPSTSCASSPPEDGPAVVTHLAARNRRMGILTVVVRSHASGMWALGDAQDVYTRSGSEPLALIRIAMGGIAPPGATRST